MLMSIASLLLFLFFKIPKTLVWLHKGLQYQALQSNVILNVFDEVKFLLDFLRNGISFQVFEP